MAKLIDQIDSSGLFAQSAYSAAIATNDDLGRKISDTYLTAVDLSPYATTAQVDTVSSLLSAGLDYVSANVGGGGGDYVPLSATEVKIGDSNTATGSYSMAQGYKNSAYYNSFAQGNQTSAASMSLAQGYRNKVEYYSFGQGQSNSAASNSFAQGNSNSAYNRSFAQGTNNSAYDTSFAQGDRNSAHYYSLAQGGDNTARSNSFALGGYNSAYNYGVAIGSNNKAKDSGLAVGSQNIADTQSISVGYGCVASGKSQALGYRVSATNSGMAIGVLNETTTAAFVIGNGYNASTGYTPDYHYSDSFIIYHDGSVSAAGKISANGVELGAGGGLAASSVILTGDNIGKNFTLSFQPDMPGAQVKPGYIGVSGQPVGASVVDVVVELKNNVGTTTATHKLTEKLDTTATAGFVSTATLNSVSSTLSGAINNVSAGVTYVSGGVTYISGAVNNLSGDIQYISANAGKTYTGVNPIQVNNTTNEISITGQSLSAGPNIDLFSSGGYVVISANGGAAGKTYTGIAPIQVDNVNDEISVDCGVVSAGPGIDIVSDANGIKFSATNFYYSNNNPTTATTSYSGLYIEKDYQQGKTTRTFYAGSEAVGELVPTGYSVGNYLTTTVAGMTWAPLPDYGAPVVLVATSGDIPASGSSDNKVYIVTGTV